MKHYEPLLYPFYDHTGIVGHLETMAAKGWLLEKAGGLWKYAPCEPQKLRYAVTYFPDTEEGGGKEELFRDLCREAGWEFVTKYKEMQIFRANCPFPTPLDTEPMVQVETIHASMKRVELSGLFSSLLNACLVIAWFFVYDGLYGLAWFLSSGLFLTILLCAVLKISTDLWQFLVYCRWHRRAAAAAKKGVFLPTRSRRWRCALQGLAVWTMILCLPLLIYQTYGNRGEDYPDNKYDMGPLHYAIYRNEMPLYMEDLVEVPGENYSNKLEKNRSPFLSRTQGNIELRYDRREGNDAPRTLDYTLWSSPFAFPLDLAQRDEMKSLWSRQAYQPIPALAGAQRTWQLYEEGKAQEQYLLRYEDHMIEIAFGFTPTQEQFTTAVQKLLNA